MRKPLTILTMDYMLLIRKIDKNSTFQCLKKLYFEVLIDFRSLMIPSLARRSDSYNKHELWSDVANHIPHVSDTWYGGSQSTRNILSPVSIHCFA
jgi:hypothetical protein